MKTQGVTWFLSGQRNRASSRLQGYLIHEYLVQSGFPSELLLAPLFNIDDVPWDLRNLETVAASVQTPIVVFQKLYGKRVERLIQLLKSRGIKTLFVECDYYPGRKTPYFCDEVVATSEYLCKVFQENGAKCRLIPDPIEVIVPYELMLQRFNAKESGKEIKLIWVGHRYNWDTLKPLMNLLQEPQFRQFQLITISSHPDADHRWQLETVNQLIQTGDIGVVPVGPNNYFQAKSNNRITLFMALGLPVIAGNIPSYESIIKNGQNGVLCRTDGDWRAALNELRDPAKRFELAKSAYMNSVPYFKLDRIGQLWISALADNKTIHLRQKKSSGHGNKQPDCSRTQVDVELNLYWAYKGVKRRQWKIGFVYGCKATMQAVRNRQAFILYLRFIGDIFRKKLSYSK